MQKKAKKKDDLVRRATQGSTMIFSESLSSKNKTELEDIANMLSLTLEGTKAALISRITAYFNDHPQFKEDKHYSGLFDCSHGRKCHCHLSPALKHITENAFHYPPPDSSSTFPTMQLQPQSQVS